MTEPKQGYNIEVVGYKWKGDKLPLKSDDLKTLHDKLKEIDETADTAKEIIETGIGSVITIVTFVQAVKAA